MLRKERLQQVMVLATAAAHQGVTVTEVARGLELKRTQFIHGLLDQLVDEGVLVGGWDEHKYPPRWRYYLRGFEPAVLFDHKGRSIASAPGHHRVDNAG